MSEALPDYYARKPSVGPGGHRTILQRLTVPYHSAMIPQMVRRCGTQSS